MPGGPSPSTSIHATTSGRHAIKTPFMNTSFAMKFSRRSTTRGGAALAAGSAAPARAQLTIDMTKPSFEPVPIAIVDFSGDRVGADIAGVIRNDLQNSRLFRSISPSSFIQSDV